MAHHRRTPSMKSFSEAFPSHSPSSLALETQPTVDVHNVKYTASNLQCISNYKLRIESSKNEPRLTHLLGHIAIYDAVREWRQSQAQASIANIMEATKRLSSPAPLSEPSLQLVEEEPEPRTTKNERPPYVHQSQLPSFSDFQAAIEVQLASMEQVKTAHRQLQQMAGASEDGEEVHEYESDAETDSDYDSYDGEEGAWRSGECSDGDESMTDPESIRSECTSPIQEKEDDFFYMSPIEGSVVIF